MMHGKNNHRIDENSHHNGGHSVQQIRHVTDSKANSLAAEFGQINSSNQTHRDPGKQGDQEKLRAPNDGVGHPTSAFADRRRQLYKKVPTQGLPSVHQQIAYDEKKD